MLFSVRIDDELELALLEPKYVQQMYDIIAVEQDYLNQWLVWPKATKSFDDINKHGVNCIKEFAEGKSLVCAIVYKGQAVGSCGYNQILPELKKVKMGYWLGEQFTGNGIMTRCVEFFIRHAFENLAMEKVEIAAAVENTASRAVIERVGGVQEGIIKNAENLHGKIVDHVVYGIYK